MAPTKIDGANVLVWTSDLELKTLEQAERTSRLPFLAGPLALMPDAHWGLGATIGSVIATNGAIVPAAVGVDIGCGMIAVETDLSADGLPDDLERMLGYIERVVPAGLGKGHDGGDWDRFPNGLIAAMPSKVVDDKRLLDTVRRQYGSLGSGNHFLEICLDERDRVWVVLHSGSRGIGKKLADIHIDAAKGMMKRYYIDLEDPDLAYLAERTAEFDAYIEDMTWAQTYAAANREAMMDAVLAQLWGFVGTSEMSSEHGVGREVQRINCHHNYTAREQHHGRNVWVTRKGAIRARAGDLGVIPGSMGTRSYIVEGLGNPASYHSCSHGAGREMGRKQARRELNVAQFIGSMGDRTWQRAKAEELLDEAPAAYKDIDVVMANQTDLCRALHELRQILNYKGTG